MASLVAIAAVVAIGYLFMLFSSVDFFPETLSIVLMVLCGIAFAATVYLFLRYIESLKG